MNRKTLQRVLFTFALAVASPSWAGLVITDTVIAPDGREWAQPSLFINNTWFEISAQCPGGPCLEPAVLNGWALDGWTWAAPDDVQGLFNAYTGQGSTGFDKYTEANSTWAPAFFQDFVPTNAYGPDLFLTALTRNAFLDPGWPDEVHVVGALININSKDAPLIDYAGIRLGYFLGSRSQYEGVWFVRSVPSPSPLTLLALGFLAAIISRKARR